jgi:hypothetical protein
MYGPRAPGSEVQALAGAVAQLVGAAEDKALHFDAEHTRVVSDHRLSRGLG